MTGESTKDLLDNKTGPEPYEHVFRCWACKHEFDEPKYNRDQIGSACPKCGGDFTQTPEFRESQ